MLICLSWRVYLSLSRRLTKSRLACDTSPFNRITRLRFLDFLVRMCRLNAFWKVILPVPVTLNRFLALEFVLTLGIFNAFCLIPLLADRTGERLWSHLGLQNYEKSRNIAAFFLATFMQSYLFPSFSAIWVPKWRAFACLPSWACPPTPRNH